MLSLLVECEEVGQFSCLTPDWRNIRRTETETLRAAGRSRQIIKNRRLSLTEMWEAEIRELGGGPRFTFVSDQDCLTSKTTPQAQEQSVLRRGKFEIDFHKFRRWQTVLRGATGLMVEVIDWPGHHQTRVFTVPIIKSHAAENHKWQSYWIETYNSARALNVVREMNNWNRRFYPH